MNNWEKSNLELTPAPEMTIMDESGMLTVLIKHDYYSSNTENGKVLLGSFLDSIYEYGDSIGKIILIDSAVKLLEDELFTERLEKLFGLSRHSFICEDSLAAFDIEYSSHDNVMVCPSSDIATEIIQAVHLLTLE